MNTSSRTTTPNTPAEGTTRWITEAELEWRLAEERRWTEDLIKAVVVRLLEDEEDARARISPSRTYGAARLSLVRSD